MNQIIFPQIYPVACHTDNIGPNSTFVAIKGMQDDGVKYIKTAIAKGATKIVVDQTSIMPQETIDLIKDKNIELLKVQNTRQALAQQSAQAAKNPANKLKIIGITGTKGKSTTSYLIEHILKTAGYKTAIISTVKNKINNTEFPAPLTTPQPDYIHQFLNLCVQESVDYVVMEVAAQALTLHRVEGILFDAAIFTNFSLEHSEFYENLDLYFNAKAELFKQLKPNGLALINVDDQKILDFSNNLDNKITYSLNTNNSNYKAKPITLNGIKTEIINSEQNFEIVAQTLVGQFNIYNILAATTLALNLKINYKTIQKAFETFNSVPGRLQRFTLPNGATAFIDYAHNPSSFDAVLSALKELTDQLIVVFGAGGDRDPIKRPIMGQIASQIADIIIVTTDNPRSEDPQEITKQIIAGIPQENKHKIIIELNREEAIKKAITLSHKNSIIALLGKGPDEYQIIKGEKIYFSEAAILRSSTL